MKIRVHTSGFKSLKNEKGVFVPISKTISLGTKAHRRIIEMELKRYFQFPSMNHFNINTIETAHVKAAKALCKIVRIKIAMMLSPSMITHPLNPIRKKTKISPK